MKNQKKQRIFMSVMAILMVIAMVLPLIATIFTP